MSVCDLLYVRLVRRFIRFIFFCVISFDVLFFYLFRETDDNDPTEFGKDPKQKEEKNKKNNF